MYMLWMARPSARTTTGPNVDGAAVRANDDRPEQFVVDRLFLQLPDHRRRIVGCCRQGRI
jgi:hypothetical protein